MTYNLYKISFPGFKKSFNTYEALRKELEQHICAECLQHGKTIDDMMSSSCGCEFMVEDPIENPETYLEALERFIIGDHRFAVYKSMA